MKPAILLLMIMVAARGLSAQDYQCLKPGTKQYFTNGTHYLRGMRVDSSFAVGSATVFYPFRSPRFVGTSNNVDSNGASWLGKKVIQLADGTTLFDNIWNDTVTIRTRAGLGESWIFYNDTSATYYTATVTKVDTERVLGQIDTVKTVRIAAMKGSAVLTANSVNGLTFALSRDHGFVRIFDLYTFPYAVGGRTAKDHFLNRYANVTSTYQFSRIDFRNPTYRDIYDFEVGDVFQSVGWLINPSLSVVRADAREQISIQTKTVTLSHTTYTFSTAGQYSAYDNSGNPVSASVPDPWRPGSVTDATLYILDSVRMPEETGNWFAAYFNPDDKSHCSTGAYYKRQHFYMVTPLDAPTNPMAAYKAGFGLVDTANGYMWGTQGAQASIRWTMYATKKNGNPCGGFTPLTVSGTPASQAELFRIYPNPARDIIHVEHTGAAANNMLLSVTLTGINGAVMYQYQGASGNLSINTAEAPAGIYMLRIVADGWVSYRKVSIIH